MKTIKFVVKVNRGGRAAEYIQRVDPTPIHMTTNPSLHCSWAGSRLKTLSNHSETRGAARS